MKKGAGTWFTSISYVGIGINSLQLLLLQSKSFASLQSNIDKEMSDISSENLHLSRDGYIFHVINKFVTVIIKLLG